MNHGAYSPKKVEPLAQQLVDDLLADTDGSTTTYLRDPSYRPALWRWARKYGSGRTARGVACRASDGQPGELDGDGEMQPAMDLLARLDGQLLKAGAQLGLEPLSRARLARDVAAGGVDMALRLMSTLDDGDASDVMPTTGADDGDDVG